MDDLPDVLRYDFPREEVACPDKATADQIRRKFSDAVVDDEDDARTTDVVLTGDAPVEVINTALEMADASWREEETRHGQLPLTRTEKLHLDFSGTNVFHARSCKAIAAGKGCSDWLAHYDHELTVDEHREVYACSGTFKGETLRHVRTPQFPMSGSGGASA